MATQLHTYALIKALYDQNKDYFDTFLPMVLDVVPEDRYLTLEKIQEAVKNKYTLVLPLHILKTIANRGKSKNFLVPRERTRDYKRTQEGTERLGNQEPVEEIERKTNSLIENLRSFFSENNVSLNATEAKELLFKFVKSNIDGLVDFINPKQAESEIVDNTLKREHCVLLISFIKQTKESKPTEYKQLQEIIYGSIIASVLSAESSTEISELETKGFKKSQVFLDTNFVFSLLEFHSDEKNKSAKELLELLKTTGFKLKVFDFTLDEICRVINGYLTKKNRYPARLEIDSIYSLLKRKGWGFSDVSEFINNIESILEKEGIEIETTQDVDLKNYTSPTNENLRSFISRNKIEDSRQLSTNHDLAAIDKIRQLRKRSVRRIEDAEAFFLTSDHGLQNTVLFELRHHDNGTLSEVILDRVLANIIWLKNPNLELPISTILASHSRDLLIDKKIWDKFYLVLEKLKNEGEITTEQIEILLYQNNINNSLKEYGKNDTDKINDILVLEAVEDAVKTITEEKKEVMKKQSDTDALLFETQTEAERKGQEYNNKIIEIKKGLRNKASRRASVGAIIVTTLIILILWAGEFFAFNCIETNLPTKYQKVYENAYAGTGLALMAFIGGISWKYIKPIIYRGLKKFLSKKFFRDFKLEDN